MKIEVSNGEIADKVSILMIKKERLIDDSKIINVSKELEEITPDFLIIMNFDHPLYLELKQVNSSLWDIEDQIRDKERVKLFDDEFVSLARAVYFINDKRAEIKKTINTITGSSLTEEKSYAKY
jgi:hypothetical protein